ncbi:MAG: hypothetical protein ABH863_03150 [Candidatus Micrarchaeota archaeon]
MALIKFETAKTLTIIYSILYSICFVVFLVLAKNALYATLFGFIAIITIAGTYLMRQEKFVYAEWLFAIAGILTFPLGGPLAACAMTLNEEIKKREQVPTAAASTKAK